MLNYDPEKSIYYDQNKAYCDTITQEIEQLEIPFSGFCSSFGYDVFVEIAQEDYLIKLNFHKHQTTGTPVIVTASADTKNYGYITFESNGISDSQTVKVNRTGFFDKILNDGELTDLDANNTLFANPPLNNSQKDAVKSFVSKHDVLFLKLKNGTFEGQIRNVDISISELNKSIAELIEILA
jgi:hypothetical protein